MLYLCKLTLFLFICLINSSESNNEEIRDFKIGPETYRFFELLNPSNLLESKETIRSLTHNGAREYSACVADLNTLQTSLTARDMWALKMVDASSKIPAGILQGNLIDLGMYDECIAIQNETLKIRAQYCQYQIAMPIQEISAFPLSPSLSICLPLNCTAEDISIILNDTINSAAAQFNFTVQIPTVSCTPVDQKVWDTEFIICFAILVVYVVFLSICTVCEIIYERCDGCRRNKLVTSLTQLSFKKNAAAIFNMEVKPGTLPMLHGLRFISMLWVVLGHEYMMFITTPTVNILSIFEWSRSLKSLYIFTSFFAVDTFFTLSGFLMTYLFIKQMSKEKKFNVFMYYLHRYLRLTPVIIALLIFTIVFVPKIGSGPRYDISMNITATECRKKWWPTVLYLGNFIYKESGNYLLKNILLLPFNREQRSLECLGHLWYLNVDMQLFWISPLILYPLYRKPKIGLMVLSSFFFVSILVPVLLISINKYHTASFMSDNEDEVTPGEVMQEIYVMTYNRAGPWLVGIYFGYEMATNKRKPKKITTFAGWLLTVIASIFCIYGTRYFLQPDYKYSAVLEAFFTGLSRPIWGFAICWIIYASFHNLAGPIASFLFCSVFLPFSRLSYTIYLVHAVIQPMQAAAFRTPKYFTDYYAWYYYIGDLVISIAVAIIFTLLFESPILALEKMIFNRKKKSVTESQKDLTISSSTEEVNEDGSKSKY